MAKIIPLSMINNIIEGFAIRQRLLLFFSIRTSKKGLFMKSVLSWISLNSTYVFSVCITLEDNIKFKALYPESSVLVKISVHTSRGVSFPTFGFPCKIVMNENKHGVIIYRPFEGIANFNALCDELKHFALFKNLRSSYDTIGMTVTL